MAWLVLCLACLVPSLAVAAPESAAPVTASLDQLWVLVAAALVFLMQAGFLALEAGSVREKAAPITALKNVADWAICAATFFLFGWALMFGHSAGGLIGADGFSLEVSPAGGWSGGLWVHFMFQLAFAGTAATIVSGAMSERTGFVAYMVVSAVVTTLIYPMFGHWAWGNSFFAGNETLLTRIGFVDFAGSTVVHSVGGWVSLVGVLIVGPRLGRFGPNGEVRHMRPYSMALSGLGVLLLWFSWWGFNGGSTLALDSRVGPIINNTNLSATFAALGSLLHCALFQHKRDITPKFLNAVLGGLVGVTAGCAIVTPLGAVAIGLTSGVLCNLASDWLLRMEIDDPVGAIPVHLFCGVWGTLCVGIFGQSHLFPSGKGRLEQIGVQLVGVVTCGLWTGATALLTFLAIKRWVGLRVSPQEEHHGFGIAGTLEEPEAVDEESLRKALEEI